ncbi:MAG TPA: Arc family DNA-binding protein [Hyphomicrobiaceae bacterium]|jgi:hypothetical protein
MPKRKPSDLIQLKVRMTEALRAQLEKDAERHGSSINSEIVRRLEHSFDRSHLLGEVLELTFGKPLAGFLIGVGLSMMTAAGITGKYHPANRDDWALEVEPYEAAQEAAQLLLSLWEPTQRRAEQQAPGHRAERQAAAEAVEILMWVLEREIAEPKGREPTKTVLELLGREIATAMIEEFPKAKKRRAAADELVEKTERKLETSSRRKAS